MSRLIAWLRPTTVAHAHCDIPCGIYDPSEAVQAARTVARMVELIGKLPEGATAVADRNTFVRCVAVKEQHAEKVKHEVQVIWSDYFKPPRGVPGPAHEGVEPPQARRQEQAGRRRPGRG
jgi:nickel superoxide dismutase